MTTKHLFLIGFNLVYLFGFAGYYVYIKNFEFLWYVAVLLFFFILIATTLHKTKFNLITLSGLSLWGLLHMAGGGIKIAGDVLYGHTLIPLLGEGELTILKYDQLVHFFGFGVATLVIYQLLKPQLRTDANWQMIAFILIISGAGLGVLNEIVEFVAVLVFTDTNVGGYYNTSLDLIFNTLGALAMTGWLCRRHIFDRV